jgi:hypothetical protein
MGSGKRRRGKQSSGRSTPASITGTEPEEEESSAAPPTPTPTPTAEANPSNEAATAAAADANEDTKMKAPEEESKKEEEKKEEADAPPPSPIDTLVLTSEKRRGVYECDYCHSDISQLPRIRCAVCNDFDLCLDCFATTDHAAAISRLKAAATAHSELKADGVITTMVTGLSNANHDDTHGYRVCDSTRYPVFGSVRSVLKIPAFGAASTTSSVKGDDEPGEALEETSKQDTATATATATATVTAAASETPEESPMEEDPKSAEYRWIASDDPKSIWTAEEELRLLDAIATNGLGNWTDISDAISGNGSVGKTPKRCMERYFDDFLGRYGHILPEYTIVGENMNDDETASNYNPASTENTNDTEAIEDWEDESARSSKRRQFARMPSNASNSSAGGGRARKRYKVVPSETIPGYQELWPNPYLPPVEGVEMGQEVARDLSTKNELTFVKLIAAAPSKEGADKIRQEWMEKRLKQRIGAPTVLPPRPEDSASLPGAELVGFMPRRGDFDIEHANDAEQALADMEFLETDTEQEKQLKVQVLQIYYQKQNERENRRQFILSRDLYDYRKYVKNEQDLPQDERDLRHRMRLFERFHTPQEHKQFIDDIIKAKRLRKEIAKLQMYRRIGIRSLAEAEKYELDKSRRQFHKMAQLQKEAEAKQAALVAAGVVATPSTGGIAGATLTPSLAAPSIAGSVTMSTQSLELAESSLWKNYRTTDRKVRRSINRSGSMASADDKEEGDKTTPAEDSKSPSTESAAQQEGNGEKESNAPEETKASNDDNAKTKDSDEAKPAAADTEDAMQVDEDKAPEEKSEEEKSATVDSKDVEMQVDADEHKDKDEDEFDIINARAYDLLSRREAALCMDLKVYPAQYLQIKKALIQESLTKGLLDKEGPGLGRRTVVKLDVKRRGDIVDFMLRAGWISNRLADVARTVTPPPSTT